MKALIVTIITLLLSSAPFSQENKWQIKLHNKTILNTSKENPGKNITKVKENLWKKTGFLEINFIDTDNDPEWYRSFIFTDKNDEELLKLDSVSTTKVPLTQLRQLFRGKKEIFVYTIKMPKDPNVAMTVRLRRVHLITLQVK